MKKHKKIKLFLLKFLGSYVLMVFLYASFLNFTQEDEEHFVCDPITQKVAEQTRDLLNFVAIKSVISQDKHELSINLFVIDKYVAKVVEGCNSVSIIILFIAFIIGFSGRFWSTIGYIFVGSLVIYLINIIRIAVIAMAIHEFPEYSELLHQIVFPLLIYGTTFLLWVIWVNRFSKKND